MVRMKNLPNDDEDTPAFPRTGGLHPTRPLAKSEWTASAGHTQISIRDGDGDLSQRMNWAMS